MRLGLFMMPVHPPGRSLSDRLAENTTKSLYADQLGFDELWMGEHFSAITEPIPSPLMFLAGLVPLAKNLTFGTAVVNLPNHHPAIVAAEAAQFDHMSGGRFMFGVGSGGLASDFELFDVFDGAVRQRKFLESIDLIQRIWAQDPPYDLEGEFWTVRIKKAIVPELGFGSHAEAVAAARTRRSTSPSAVPNSSSARDGRAARLGHHLRPRRAELFDRLALEGLQRGLPRGRQAGARRELARLAQRDGGADRRGGRRTARSASAARTGISTATCTPR